MHRDELAQLSTRISVVVYAIATVFVLLLAGFWHFQIAQSGRFAELADKNRFKQIPMLAPRGKILDREGRILVDNTPSYDIVYSREGARHSIAETARILAPGIGMTEAELIERVNKNPHLPKYQPIVLKEDVEFSDMAFVAARQMELQPEITVEYHPRRRYLEGDLGAHAIGYIGEINPDDLKKSAFKQYKSGDLVGKAGLEYKYDSILRGKDGYRLVIVDNWGREIKKLEGQDPVAGHPIRTTLDLDLQRAAEEALGDQVGAAIALDPVTSEVLVLASRPAFDPNLFATKLSAAKLQGLNSDPRKPFRNRVVQDPWAPGSVFKIFMAAAALEAEVVEPGDHVNCTGLETIYGVTKHCWKAGGHGSVTMYQAIVNSCNVFFYNLGQKLDIDKIAHYAMLMGLGKTTGIDLPSENGGLIPTREWKATRYKTAANKIWYPSETLDVSIGQGAVGLTPLQAAWAMGGLASGGRLVQPHLVNPETLRKDGFAAPKLRVYDYPIHAKTVDIIARGMWGVVNDGGTGTRAAVPGFDVAGKTGTAQVVGRESYGKSDDFEDNAWFVGFAPYRHPEIVVAAFVEHGGHGGSAAAPIAHAIFDTYYKKKTGQFGVPPSGPVAQVILER